MPNDATHGFRIWRAETYTGAADTRIQHGYTVPSEEEAPALPDQTTAPAPALAAAQAPAHRPHRDYVRREVRKYTQRQLTLIDFKTTSASTRAHFLATIEKYYYDRHAALYLDVLGATRFLIIGVQKKDPHAVWRVELTATPALIEQGRKKYTTLLRHHARQADPLLRLARPPAPLAMAA